MSSRRHRVMCLPWVRALEGKVQCEEVPSSARPWAQTWLPVFLAGTVFACSAESDAGSDQEQPTNQPAIEGTSADASDGPSPEPGDTLGPPESTSNPASSMNGGSQPQTAPLAQGGASSPEPAGEGDAVGSGGESAADSPGGSRGDAEVIAEPLDDAARVFDQETVRVYDITVSEEDLALIDQNPAGEMYVEANIAVDGDAIGPVGLRYKGSVGAFLYPCTTAVFVGAPPGFKIGKCSLKVDFDRVDENGRYHGLKKLNFHAMNNDPSMLRERLAYGLFREVGIATPRAMHARVNINGRFEGLFIAVEQVDGRFTRSRFTDGGDGNLYKEVWPMHDSPESYRAALETNEDATPPLDRIAAFAAAAEVDSAAVERFVDRDYVLRLLAADRVMANDDGSAHWWCFAGGQGNNPGGIGNHNYYWYEDELAGRFWLVPWDMDSSLRATDYVHIQPEWRTQAACTCSGEPAQRPTSCDPLFSIWASWSADYETAVDEFLRGPFETSRVEQKLATWSAQIEPHVIEAAGLNGAPGEAAWQTAVTALRDSIDLLRRDRGWP